MEEIKMDDRLKQMKQEVLDFFKAAFCIDGKAEFVSEKEADRLLRGANINIIRMTDTKRGMFYVAQVKPYQRPTISKDKS